uniref:chitinase n=1 Tax=Arcella intermedia TaxID=1963864 RepID=A0A6B2LAJ2_9EUKA
MSSSLGPPYFVVYNDQLNSWWPPTAIAAGLGVPTYAHNSSYNIFNLAFWLTTGPADTALVWSNALTYVSSDNPWGSTTTAVQAAWLNLYHKNGIKLMVSAFGATEFPTSAGVDPVQCGHDLANFVINNQLDGVDLDWEDNAAMEAGTGEQWLINITRTLRQLLPKEKGYIISHAPQAPYFMGTSKYPKGGYLTVHKAVGDLIDFYNIQFYNQGNSQYSSFETLFVSSDGWASQTSVGEMITNGIAPNKIVVGKPISRGDVVNTGFVPVDSLAQFLQQGRGKGWNAGFMGWQYKSDSDGSWSQTLSKAFQ